MANTVVAGIILLIWIAAVARPRVWPRSRFTLQTVVFLVWFAVLYMSLRTGLATPDRDALLAASLGALVVAVVWSLLLLQKEDRPEPPDNPASDETRLYHFSKLRSWRAEFAWLLNAVHELRCLLRMFEWERFKPFGKTNYCGTASTPTACEINQGRWWWPGYCFFHKCEKWEAHVDSYDVLKEGQLKLTPTSREEWDAHRIDFLYAALATIDIKCGSLMTFNSVLLSATTFLLANPRFAIWSATVPRPLQIAGIVWLLAWGFTIYLCVRSQSDAVWSDPVANPRKEPEIYDKHETLWVRELIGHVVIRTARLRVAVATTIGAALWLMLILSLTALSYRRPSAQASSGIPTVSALNDAEGFRVTFPVGAACPDERTLPTSSILGGTIPTGPLVDDLAAQLLSSGHRRLDVVGSATVQALGAQARSTFGNNVGLALERAQCVARILQTQLALKGIYVRTEVSVRRPEYLDPTAVTDRAVEVRVSR